MIRTNGELCEEILQEVYAGFPSNVQRLDERFVLRKINETKAFLARKNAFENNNAEGVTYVDGAFLIQYTGLTLLADTVYTGLKSITLSAMPIGLPRSRSVTVFPPAATGGAKSAKFKPIAWGEIQLLNSLPSVPNTIFYAQVSEKLYFASKENALINAYATLNATIATSGGVDMDSVVNLPDDYVAELKSTLLPQLRQMLFQPTDNLNDGLDQPVGGEVNKNR